MQQGGRAVYQGPAQSAPYQMYVSPAVNPTQGVLTSCNTCWAGPGAGPNLDGRDGRAFEFGFPAVWLRRHGTGREQVLRGVDWKVLGRTKDGELVSAEQAYLAGDPMSTVVLVKRSADAPVGSVEVVYDRVVDAGATLPVRVRLPRGQGWLIVAHAGAALRWRAPGGSWQQPRGPAALLPDTQGVTVEVTLQGHSTQLPLR